MKIYFIAGEQSGDNIGVKIINHLKNMASNIEISGIGGIKMQEHFTSLFDIKNISLFGFAEIFPHIFKLMKLINFTVNDIIKKRPDILVTIDSPSFCFRVAKKIKEKNLPIKLIHIVAPSVWAYKPDRAKKIAAIYDLLLAILPFEPPLFEKHGLKTVFIGHPIFEENFSKIDKDKIKNEHNIKNMPIVITPGSRKQEIIKMLPIFLNAINILCKNYNITTIIVTIKNYNSLISNLSRNFDHEIIISNDKLPSFASSYISIAKSGTNVLELLALDNFPIVCYKLNFFTWEYIKRVVNVKYASIINIIAKNEIIPELIQHNCTSRNIANLLMKYIDNQELRKQKLNKSKEVLYTLGLNSNFSSSYKAAIEILKMKQ